MVLRNGLQNKCRGEGEQGEKNQIIEEHNAEISANVLPAIAPTLKERKIGFQYQQNKKNSTGYSIAI